MARGNIFQDFDDFLSNVDSFYSEIICSALGHHFMNPKNWSCPEEGIITFQLLTICECHGVNTFKEEWDPVNCLIMIDRSFTLGFADWFKQTSASEAVSQVFDKSKELTE